VGRDLRRPRGRGRLTVAGEEVEVGKGDGVFVEVGVEHRFSGYERLSLLVVFDKS